MTNDYANAVRTNLVSASIASANNRNHRTYNNTRDYNSDVDSDDDNTDTDSDDVDPYTNSTSTNNTTSGSRVSSVVGGSTMNTSATLINTARASTNNSLTINNNDGWNVVSRSKNKTVAAVSNEQGMSKIPITSEYYLYAKVVKEFSDLHDMVEGRLYYVENADHFALMISGMFVHGNIGKIYTNEKDPMRIKNCRYSGRCISDKCDYYHNPMFTSGCRDHRNYIASSWLYAPPVYPYKNKRRARRFGDRDNIDVDLPALSSEESERFLDQTMHDILCCLLLARFRAAGTKNV